jgi:hypothetical protein
MLKKLEVMSKGFFKNIQNFKVLDLNDRVNLESFPKELENLRQLTHLEFQMCVKLNIYLKKKINMCN